MCEWAVGPATSGWWWAMGGWQGHKATAEWQVSSFLAEGKVNALKRI